jgi:pyruvate,water dikinase
MKFLDPLKRLFKRKKSCGQDGPPAPVCPLTAKYNAFRQLLALNNAVLELMADMTEKLTGEYLFDRGYVDESVLTAAEKVRGIIENLDIIADDRYYVLYKNYYEISERIHKAMTKRETPVGRCVIPMRELSRDDEDLAGGKMSNLGEVLNRVGLPVPDGFSITAYAFMKFMEHNDFLPKVSALLEELKVDDLEAINALSADIRSIIIAGRLPDDIEEEISAALSALRAVSPSTTVAVRSSALVEDGGFSFAGQYSTFLNVPFDLVTEKYREVVASLFNPRALFYFKTKGFEDHDLVMSVGVLSMLEPKSGGVMYSCDPVEGANDDIIISAVKGLGASLVDGTASGQTYTLKRPEKGASIDFEPAADDDADRSEQTDPAAPANPKNQTDPENQTDQADRTTPAAPADLAGRRFLDDEEVTTLAAYALKLERHFGCPQDVEWAVDGSGKVFILQSRPLLVLSTGEKKKPPSVIKGYDVIISTGVVACKGVGMGKARIVRKDEDLKDFPQGAVLVARHTSPGFVTVMDRASAIVTDIGSSAGHMASLAREHRIPAILDTGRATSLIKDGQEITVDAVNCNVYDGIVEELREFAVRDEDTFFKKTHIFETFARVLKHIVPLNLLDPDGDDFKPESCRTLHDITRFSHETAMRELFSITDLSADEHGAKRLSAPIPMELYLLDLGGGLKKYDKRIYVEHLDSIPFTAFYKGLSSMPWPQPRPLDVGGFLGAIAHTAALADSEIKSTAEKSFTVISRHYMNFAIRLGYHLASAEAYASENVNDNYIRYHFRGGGSSADRRLRRVRLITEILRHMDFNVNVKGDSIEANLMKHKENDIVKRVEVLGRFTVFTKQLDMTLYNDEIVNRRIREFQLFHMSDLQDAAGNAADNAAIDRHD